MALARVMALVNLHGPHACGIVDGRELVALDLLPLFPFEGQELDVHLNVMAGNLFAIPLGVDLAHAGAARQAVQAIAPEDSVDTGIRHLDAMIPLQVPDDADRPEMVFAPQM